MWCLRSKMCFLCLLYYFLTALSFKLFVIFALLKAQLHFENELFLVFCSQNMYCCFYKYSQNNERKTPTSLIKISLVTIDMATRNRCICTLVAFLLSSILCDQQYVLWKSDVTVVRSWEKRDREEEELLERQREGTSRAVWLRCLIQVVPRFNQCSCG